MLTLEEQERRAYISGDTRAAKLLAHCVDGDEQLSSDLQLMEEQRNKAQRDLEEAEEHIADLEEQLGLL